VSTPAMHNLPVPNDDRRRHLWVVHDLPVALRGNLGVVHLSARPSVTGIVESRLIIHAEAWLSLAVRLCLSLGVSRLLGGPHLEIGVEGCL